MSDKVLGADTAHHGYLRLNLDLGYLFLTLETRFSLSAASTDPGSRIRCVPAFVCVPAVVESAVVDFVPSVAVSTKKMSPLRRTVTSHCMAFALRLVFRNALQPHTPQRWLALACNVQPDPEHVHVCLGMERETIAASLAACHLHPKLSYTRWLLTWARFRD